MTENDRNWEIRKLTKKGNSESLCTVIPSAKMAEAELEIGDHIRHEEHDDEVIILKDPGSFLTISTDRKITIPFRIARETFKKCDYIGFSNDEYGHLCYKAVTL